MEGFDTAQVMASTEQFERCDACNAPVDREQRYCVSCGAHRRNVPDPAARYLALASARTRARRTHVRSGARGAGREHRVSLLLVALVLVAIPVAVAVGVAVGHSGTSNAKLNGKLLQALDHPPKARVVDLGGASGSTGTTGTSGTTGSASGGKHRVRGPASKKTAGSSGGSGKVIAKTQYGSVTQLVGSHVTAAAKKEGAAVAKKVAAAKGQNYVNQQNSLPTTVSEP